MSLEKKDELETAYIDAQLELALTKIKGIIDKTSSKPEFAQCLSENILNPLNQL
jgi:hypothetical protein